MSRTDRRIGGLSLTCSPRIYSCAGGPHSAQCRRKGEKHARTEGVSGHSLPVIPVPSPRSPQRGDVRRDARARCSRRRDGLCLEESAFVSDYSDERGKSRRPSDRSWTARYVAPAWFDRGCCACRRRGERPRESRETRQHRAWPRVDQDRWLHLAIAAIPRQPSTRASTGGVLDQGTWVSQGFFSMARGISGWPFTEKGRAHVASQDPLQTSHTRCIPVTAPMLMLYPVTNQIEIDGDIVRMKIDWMDSERVILHGRPQPSAECRIARCTVTRSDVGTAKRS